MPPAAHIASRGARVHLRPALVTMAPTMAQRDWERRARSKHRAGGSHASPWHHPHATWLTLVVVAVVLLQGVLYGRVHARSMRIQTADDEIARRAEAIRVMLVKQEDLREQVASLREVVVRMDTAVVDTLEKGAAAKLNRDRAPTKTETDAGSSVKSLREQQRILMDRASLANRLAGIAPTDADEAFFDANDAALQEIREERAAYGRREQMETAGSALVWSNAVKDAMATGAKPVLAYPNAGGDYDATRKRWVGDGEEANERLFGEWLRSGARGLGGCCRTTPEWIARLVAFRDGRR